MPWNWKFWQKEKPKPLTKIVSIAEEMKNTPFIPLTTNVQVIEKPAEESAKDRMDPAVKAKWVAALRSGAYKQGKNFLRQRKPHQRAEYCCLGVLCEIAAGEGVISSAKRNLDAMEFNAYSYGPESYSLVPPPEVTRWARLPNGVPNPSVPYKDAKRSMSFLNDREGLDFNQIADIIEEQL